MSDFVDQSVGDRLATVQVVTFQFRVMVLAKEDYGKKLVEWAGKAVETKNKGRQKSLEGNG